MTTTLPSPKDSRQPEGAAGLAAPLGSASFSRASCLNADCMAVMSKLADKSYDLAICDPPYGIGDRLVDGGGTNAMIRWQDDYRRTSWDVAPDAVYFQELFRVSKNQIICGGNYFVLPPTRGIIAWDKKVHVPSMSRWEMFWTSFDCPARMVNIRSADRYRIHPTQKPINLYGWLLRTYAQPGWRILDTHMGSGSSVVAAVNADFEMLACEIDATYFATAVERIGRELQQGVLL